MMTLKKMAKNFGMSEDMMALSIYFGYQDLDDATWCACGDKIIHEPPYNDPVYFDDKGQYCCGVCAETKHWEINGIPNYYEQEK